MIEMPRIDDDIWKDVRRHDWKYRRRTLAPTLIELHATRSGISGRTPINEYVSTLAWAKSAGNINPRPPDTWGSMESFVCGGGRVARVLEDDFYPHYGLGHADPEAFAIEIGQNLNTTPFDPQDLDNAARICAFLCATHDIPPRVLDYLSVDNHEAPGMVRHDRSANGAYLVKSDPGDLFDDRAFESRVRSYLQEEDDMTFIGTAYDEDHPLGTSGFKSWRVFVGPEGQVKTLNQNAMDRESLGPVPFFSLTKQQLSAYTDV